MKELQEYFRRLEGQTTFHIRRISLNELTNQSSESSSFEGVEAKTWSEGLKRPREIGHMSSHMSFKITKLPHSKNGETPFQLMYETKVVIPVEVEDPSWRKTHPL